MPKLKMLKKKIVERSEHASWKLLSVVKSFEDTVDVAQLDLVDDLDEEFFSTSYELVQRLVPLNNFVAGKMKRYVDILARLHSHYAAEVAAAKEITEKVQSVDQKLRIALEATSASEYMMEKLRESTAEAWRTADAAQYRESLQQDTQVDIVIKDVPTKVSEDHETLHPKEAFIRGIVFRERDRLARELREYQRRLETNRFYSASLESIIEDHRRTIKTQQIRVKQMESDMFTMEHKNRVNVENLEEKVISQGKEIARMQDIISNMRILEKKLLETSTINEHLKQTIDRLSNENFILLKTNYRIEGENRRCRKVLKDLEADHKTLLHDSNELQQVIRANRLEKKKILDVYAILSRRFHQLSKKNAEHHEQELLLTNDITVFEKKLLVATAKVEETIRQKEEVERARKKLAAELSSRTHMLDNVRHDLVIQRTRVQDVQQELDRSYKMLDDKDKSIHNTIKENQNLQVEVTDLNKAIESLEGKVTKRTQKITELKEQLEQKHQSLLKVKKQLETVHTEKTMLEKNLNICGKERQTFQNVNAKLSFQINQLCNQLANNEKDMSVLRKRIDQLDNLVKHKQNEIHGKEEQLKRMRIDLGEIKMRNEQLQQTVERDERRVKQIATRLDETNTEKSLVGQQIVRRNDELRVQREKLSMMQLAMKRGTMQYNQRIEDIRLLKTEITNLYMSNKCMQRAIADTANMRREIVRLERQLLRERLHVAAFTEEMKYPYRIHRWRVLAGKDPGKYQLIRKIQVLLKRNIRQSVVRVNLEQKVQDIQRLYDTLKQQLQHMPDPNIVQRLWLQQRINQRQSRKVRAMKAELAINDIDLKSRDLIINEYQQVFKKEHQQQREQQQREQQQREKQARSSKVVSKLFKIISITPASKYDRQIFHMTPSSDDDLSLKIASTGAEKEIQLHFAQMEFV